MSFLAILTAVWGVVKSFFSAILTFCSKPPGSWIALALGILLAFWLWGNHRYDAGVAAQTATDKVEISLLAGNVKSLKDGVKTCNDSILDLKKKGDAKTADANKEIAKLEGLSQQLAANVAAMKKIPSTAEKCPVADQIIQRGFQ
jgi:hypothetical protein